MIRKKLYFIMALFISVFSQNTFSQSPFSILSATDSIANDTNHLYLHGDLTQFLKNNEYFSPIVEGYTLFGTNLKAGGFLQPSPKAKVYLGFTAIKFYGDKHIDTFSPECYIDYRFNKSVSVVMGSLYRRPELHLIPMLTNHETAFTESSNEGLSFVFDTKRLQWNIWVAWLNFLHPNEHSQEKIFLGNTLEYAFVKSNRIEIAIPFQFTAYHLGGQINDEFTPLHMIFNNAAGLSGTYNFDRSNIKARYCFVGYKDNSSKSDYVYQNGNGHLVDVSYTSKHIQTALSYWNGFQFFSPVGETYYSSISARIPLDNPPQNQPKRELLTAHFYYNTQLAKGLQLMCGTQLLFDTKNSICDYSYSFVLRYSGSYKLSH